MQNDSSYTGLISGLMYNLLGSCDLRISILEADGDEISEQGGQDIICQYAHSDSAVYDVCLRCCAQGIENAKKSGRPYTFRCHLGLAVTALPLMQDGICRGFLMLNGYCMESEAMELLPVCRGGSGTDTGLMRPGLREGERYFLPERKVRAIIQTFSSMIACMNGISSDARTLINLQEIDPDVLTGVSCFPCHNGDESSRIVEQAMRIVDEHMAEDLSLHRMASDLYISTTYFCRLFRAKTGIKFSDYLAQQRIGRSKLLLATTELPISAIARQVGYSEANSFSRLFRAHTGITPTQYRKSCRL